MRNIFVCIARPKMQNDPPKTFFGQILSHTTQIFVFSAYYGRNITEQFTYRPKRILDIWCFQISRFSLSQSSHILLSSSQYVGHMKRPEKQTCQAQNPSSRRSVIKHKGETFPSIANTSATFLSRNVTCVSGREWTRHNGRPGSCVRFAR